MKGALKYADPALIIRTRPAGPIAPRQQAIIQDGMTRCGYSEETRRTVLFNRIGKHDLEPPANPDVFQPPELERT